MNGSERRARVLLGGVPFGRDNIGDEAILECSVGLVRKFWPSCQITAATGDQESTERRLGISTCPLIGFPPYLGKKEIEREIRAHDCFIWCGATGLSDYPEVSLRLLQIAQRLRKKTIVWGVGMNSELNPVLYRVLPGYRRRILSLISSLTLHAVDAIHLEEQRRALRVRSKIQKYLNRANLVVVRDEETKVLVQAAGVNREVIVGGDCAIMLKAAPLSSVPLAGHSRSVLASSKKKVGVCISAQQNVKDRRGLLGYLNGLVEDASVHVVFIPMNPVTDMQVMAHLQEEMTYPDRSILLCNVYGPQDIMAVVSTLDVVVSSRLHLLIMASNAGIPMVGIARGTKFINYLRHYELDVCASVDQCDFAELLAATREAMSQKNTFKSKCERVHGNLCKKLASVSELIADAIQD